MVVQSVRVSIVPFVHMMTNNGNDVIAPTAQAAKPAITFPSLLFSEAAFFLPPLSLCLNHYTWRRYALSRAPYS